MKKSSKPLIVIIASLLVLITVIIIAAQGLRLKYEELQRELAQLENRVKTEKSQLIGLKANYQMLTDEDIIKKFASDELGLIEASSDQITVISLSKKEIKNLSISLEAMNE